MTSKQRVYSVTTKLQATEAVEKSSKEAAASQFGVDQVRVGLIHATRVSHHDLRSAYSMKVINLFALMQNKHLPLINTW